MYVSDFKNFSNRPLALASKIAPYLTLEFVTFLHQPRHGVFFLFE